MINLSHPRAVLASRLPWPQIEAALAPYVARRARVSRVLEYDHLFGSSLQIAGAGVAAAGRPRLPIRLMASLLHLNHDYKLSVEALVLRWADNVHWQFFSGMTFYEPRLPCNATHIVRTTVQEKAIAHPLDSRLLEIARHQLVAEGMSVIEDRAASKVKVLVAFEGYLVLLEIALVPSEVDRSFQHENCLLLYLVGGCLVWIELRSLCCSWRGTFESIGHFSPRRGSAPCVHARAIAAPEFELRVG